MRSKAQRTRAALRRLAHLLVIIPLIHGCAALELPRYESPPAAAHGNVQVKDGLAVAVRPFLDDEENKKYFGTALVAGGIVAAYVLSENRSPSGSFVVPKDGISLAADLARARAHQGEVQSTAAAEATLMVGAILLSPLALGIGAKLFSDASVINHTIRAQEFHTRTLSPGQQGGGFVYFQLPEKATLPERWAIQVDAAELSGSEKKRFVFEFGRSGGAR